MKKFWLTVLLCTCTVSALFADAAPLPRGYTTVQLGMTVEETKSALLKNGDFGYRGDRDVSLLPGENRTLIETRGFNILKECWFQFQDEALFTITINVNPEVMDYYSIFSTLCEKYGNPQELNPSTCTWRNDEVIMTLEKPLTIKYMDAEKAARMAEESATESASVEVVRQMFLDTL